MKKNPPPVVEFEYQELDLTEAQRLVPRNISKYYDLYIGIVNRIENTPDGKAFILAPKETLGGPELHNIVNSIKHHFSKVGIPWTVKVSLKGDAIVCLPKIQKVGAKPRGAYHRRYRNSPVMQGTGDLAQTLKVAEKTFGIAAKDIWANDKDLMAAICFVANRYLHMKLADVSKVYGMGNSTASVIVGRIKTHPKAKAKLNQLLIALKTKGVIANV